MAEVSRLNAITIRDTVDNIEIAESLIAALDREGEEVLVDLELIEVNTTDLQDIREHSPLGASTSTATVDQKGAAPPGGNQGELARRIRSSTGSERIAGPRLRVVAGERGSIFVGERVALPSATLGSAESEQATSPGDGITPQDLGIRIEVVPRVHEDKKITLKLAIEMSSLPPDESPESRTARGSVVA